MRVLDFITGADPAKVAEIYAREYGSEDGWAKPETFAKFRGIVSAQIPVNDGSDIKVVISQTVWDGAEHGQPDLGVERGWDVSGIGAEGTFALEFNPWGWWSHREVEHPEGMSADDVATHLFYEMTWAGWPEDIEERAAHLEDQLEKFARTIDGRSS